MRLRQILQTAAGTLAVAAAMVLSVPGVQVAQASEPVAAQGEFDRFLAHTDSRPANDTAARDTASCGAGKVNDSSARLSHLMGAVRQQMEADAAREGKAKVEIVVLNSRGYNYGAAARPELEHQLIEQELAR